MNKKVFFNDSRRWRFYNEFIKVNSLMIVMGLGIFFIGLTEV